MLVQFRPAPIAAALFFVATSSLTSADVTLIQNGKARAVIIAPAAVMAEPAAPAAGAPPPPPNRLRESVLDLARCLEKISGAKVEIVTNELDRKDPRSRMVPIAIGAEAEKRFGPPAKTSPYKQGFRMVVGKKGVGLLGESEEATSYAIYELLDRLGCRWYIPGEWGEVLPSMKTIRLKDIDLSHVPATVSRDIWYADAAYKRRNRQGGLTLSAGHALEISGYISKEDLQKHPDWNAEIGGKRSVNGRFCWGNPEVAAAVADGIIRQLDAKYTPTVSLSPDDGVAFCQCAKCKALDTGDYDAPMDQVSITDRYVHFCNQIAERVTKKYPDVLFGFLAYVQYTRPPLREKLHANLIPEIAPINYCRGHAFTDPACPSRQQIKYIVEGWGKAAKRVAYYNYMYHLAEPAAPYPMIRQMTDELPVIYRSNVVFWQPETLPNFESALPGFYLSIRKSWYTDAEAKPILDEFYARFYGAAEKPMRRYWEGLEDAWNRSSQHAGCGFAYNRRFTPEVLAAARQAIEEALASCRTDEEWKRVTMQDETLRQFEHFMKLRWDLYEGRFANLERDARTWADTQTALGKKYEPQSAFAKTYWAERTVGTYFFDIFFRLTYNDATRITREGVVLTQPIRKWRYAVDKEKKGDGLGWAKSDFNDASWKETDSCLETWADLGISDYYGTVWYRTTVKTGELPAGKKVYLWLAATDGTARVLVNGVPAPYVDAKGERKESSSGFCAPTSYDITAALRSNAENQITVVGTRTFINELGTGGLLGPAVVYREK